MFVTIFCKMHFPNALEYLNDKEQELKNYFNDKKEKQNEKIKFYFINKCGKVKTKIFRDVGLCGCALKRLRFSEDTWELERDGLRNV